LVAVGSVGRIVLGELAMMVPLPLYGVLIKTGLTETLAFIAGFVSGTALGFVTGALIIVVSDIFISPGPWTPFIALIVGVLFGAGAGLLQRLGGKTDALTLGAFAVALSFLDELLQNTWVSIFFNVPFGVTMALGPPHAEPRIAENAVEFSLVDSRIHEEL